MTTRLQDLARRLTDGSRILARRLADRTAAWVRAGRRDDLTGLPAILGCVLRALLVLLGLYLLWRLVRAFPNLLWLIVPVWCWRAIRAAPPGKAETDHPETVDGPPPGETLRALIADLIGDRPGVHLSVLLDHLQKHGQGEGWTVADLKTRLPLLGVPVRRSVKVRGRVAYGVHRDDLPAPSPAEDEEAAA